LTNKASRENDEESLRPASSLCKKLNAKLLLDLHLDPSHKGFMLFEAPTAEAVRDIVTMSGFMYYLDLDFHLVTPIADILKHVDEMPTIF
jgi:hypothetical protein